MTPAMELLADMHLPPMLSVVVVYGVALAPFVLLIAFSLWRVLTNRRLAALQARAAERADELRGGPAVLSGTVLGHERADVPVLRVEIDQLLAELRGSTKQWQESDRRVEGYAFDLRLPSGESVTVQADSHTVFAAELDQTTPLGTGTQRRTRKAELVAGDQVHVAGELVAGEGRARQAGGDYRSAPQRGWVLRRSATRKLVVSTRPLRARFDEQAAFWRGWIWIIVVGLLLLHGGLFIPFHLSACFGHGLEAEVAHLDRRTEKDSDGNVVHHYIVKAKTLAAPHREVTDEVDSADFAKLERGATIAVRAVPWSSWFDQVGSLPTISLFSAILSGVVLIGFVGVMVGSERYTRKWYEGAHLNDPAD